MVTAMNSDKSMMDRAKLPVRAWGLSGDVFDI